MFDFLICSENDSQDFLLLIHEIIDTNYPYWIGNSKTLETPFSNISIEKTKNSNES